MVIQDSGCQLSPNVWTMDQKWHVVVTSTWWCGPRLLSRGGPKWRDNFPGRLNLRSLPIVWKFT